MGDIYSMIDDLKVSIKAKDYKIKELYQIIAETRKKTNMFNYNIDKETFIKCMSSLEALDKFISKLNDVGINLFENYEINTVIDNFTDLLSNCVDDEINQKNIYSNLSYFIYDLDWGKNYKPGMVKEDGKDVNFSTIENMWEYFVRKRDKENDE